MAVGLEDVVEEVGVVGAVAGEERIVEELVPIWPASVGSPADDSIDCPRTMNAAACLSVSLAMAGMMLPRVMRKRLLTRLALISLAACMKSRRSITARPLLVRARSRKSMIPFSMTETFSRKVSLRRHA